MEEANIIGIDLAKRSFQAHGARADGSVAYRKKLSRAKLASFIASRPRSGTAVGRAAHIGWHARARRPVWRVVPKGTRSRSFGQPTARRRRALRRLSAAV